MLFFETPLHHASTDGNIDVVRMLVKEQGADVNAKDLHGQTPLHLASERGHADMVRMLVEELCADVNAKGRYGRTPLHLASMVNMLIDVGRMLVKELGADVNVKDVKGRTALHLASVWGHIDIVLMLIQELSANVNARDHTGKTPLYIASEWGHIEIVQALVGEGADVNAGDSDGQTATRLWGCSSRRALTSMRGTRTATRLRACRCSSRSTAHLSISRTVTVAERQYKALLSLVLAEQSPHYCQSRKSSYTVKCTIVHHSKLLSFPQTQEILS